MRLARSDYRAAGDRSAPQTTIRLAGLVEGKELNLCAQLAGVCQGDNLDELVLGSVIGRRNGTLKRDPHEVEGQSAAAHADYGDASQGPGNLGRKFQSGVDADDVEDHFGAFSLGQIPDLFGRLIIGPYGDVCAELAGGLELL